MRRPRSPPAANTAVGIRHTISQPEPTDLKPATALTVRTITSALVRPLPYVQLRLDGHVVPGVLPARIVDAFPVVSCDLGESAGRSRRVFVAR
jgi:hypothetical protein